MEAKEIIEGNKLIAKFMGVGVIEFHEMLCECEEDKSPWDYDPIKWFEPYQNWSDLMPVVEKIESLGYKITIEGFCCVIYKEYGEPVAYCSNFDTKINATYHAVTAFVNWYYRIK